MTNVPVPKSGEVEPSRYGPSDYESLVEMGAGVDLPSDPAELHRIALEVICSKGVPCYLTPYGAVRSVAAFAIGATADPFYNDGRVLLAAALSTTNSPQEAPDGRS